MISAITRRPSFHEYLSDRIDARSPLFLLDPEKDTFCELTFALNAVVVHNFVRNVELFLNRFRCPVDLYVFPELHKAPDGALEAEFYAFKIPDSNLLVFQATVRTCRGPCEPVICTDRGRPGTFPSWGRRKRDVNDTIRIEGV